VCLVGANGTGKSHLLELLAACAHRLGLSPGVELSRGDPFNDKHDFELVFYLAEGVSDALDVNLATDPAFTRWDRTLLVESRRGLGDDLTRVVAGGIVEEDAKVNFANRVISNLRESKDVYFLFLDADRSYPKKQLPIHDLAQAYEIDWEGPEYTRGRSFRSSSTLYDEWIKYFLAQENQSGTQLIQGIRRARKSGSPLPDFEDHFSNYTAAVQKVLPHVLFTGVDSKKRTILFDTTGLELSFDQLSGGEREIAFLIGQIDRFGLRQGLFLLDEPELHLNSDLIRAWISYLVSTVSTGQIWLATHSLEAVEAAGLESSFVLERNEGTRKVDKIAPLNERPVLSALSRAVGSPAFSISQLAFIFVEGEEGIGEREMFRRLAAGAEHLRFVEGGSCHEILRRVETVKTLATQGGVEVRIGGVVDKDFRSTTDAAMLQEQSGVYVLGAHEVENLFLYPHTVALLLTQNGRTETAEQIIRDASDARAGCWIFQYAMATRNAKALPEIATAAKDAAKSLSWPRFAEAQADTITAILEATGYSDADKASFRNILTTAVVAYERKRAEGNFWRTCEGKQVLNEAARSAGFADAQAMKMAAFAIWEREGAQLPEELQNLRSYLLSL
jgi:energy-coupling factor transporter ATP-binding protein EcfA2